MLIIFFFVVIVYLLYFSGDRSGENILLDINLETDGLIDDLFWMDKSVIDAVIGDEVNKGASDGRKEAFMGGYRYFYTYPYYWPFFFSGCSSDPFNNITCSPIYEHPFW